MLVWISGFKNILRTQVMPKIIRIIEFCQGNQFQSEGHSGTQRNYQ